ncbi:MAG: bifunctional phosphopantothenoylcysteine decarboxylase/phosphopantothenate--cysteine ligase CoaBC [Alphaproteobacteria bacterium]|nr:bifunctional phosphopantothenoylcysteine decarboxylase/phosphopantothenate--cysteine ligase CoaBC [Alphaproteobacteria bacterium]
MRILLIITGGIAAYKTPELIRQFRRAGIEVATVLTEAAKAFVTPMTISSVSQGKVYSELFNLTDEQEMGHIKLGRQADLIVVAPATADFMARLALGLANDLATTTCLATTQPILLAPAMNVRMWEYPATQGHLATLQARGVRLVGPNEGDMACGEYGLGRMAEPAEIFAAAQQLLQPEKGLQGLHALVTAGPTQEPLDAVRYLANRSSGRQGYAIAEALAAAGARVTMVTGPTNLSTPAGVVRHNVTTAQEMLQASLAALPADIAICAAAVSDWRLADPNPQQKWKREQHQSMTLNLAANPDILASLAQHPQRPSLLIGFGLETENLQENAIQKRAKKGCDWLLANLESAKFSPFGNYENEIVLVNRDGVHAWPRMTKPAIAAKLTAEILTWRKSQP